MPYTYLPNGSVVIDSLAEALAYENARKKPKFNVPAKQEVKPTMLGNQLGTWEAFVELISAKQCVMIRKVVALVKGRGPAGYTREELSRALGIEPSSLNGTLGGVSRASNRAGVTDQIVLRGKDGKLRAGVLLQARDPPAP